MSASAWRRKASQGYRLRFADSDPKDIENHTNRSPYPMLHLLREDSIDRAVAAYPEPDAIIERNLDTMRRLGPKGLAAVLAGRRIDN